MEISPNLVNLLLLNHLLYPDIMAILAPPTSFTVGKSPEEMAQYKLHEIISLQLTKSGLDIEISDHLDIMLLFGNIRSGAFYD